MTRQLKRLFWGIALCCSGLLSHAQIEIINLSTGVNNTTGGLINIGGYDDTWTVLTPKGSLVLPQVHGVPAWAQSLNCSQWVTPSVDPQSGAKWADKGSHIYTARFRINTRNVDCARLMISKIGADNWITGMAINGHSYTTQLNMPLGNQYSTLQTRTLYIDPAHLIGNGVNTISFIVYNVDLYSGMNLCANLEVNPASTILSGFNGPSTFCVGDPLSFTGYLSAGSGPTTHYLWGIQECNSAGTVVSGGFSWELWHYGTPGAFTFPANLNLPCNKHYRVRMAAVYDDGNCLEWSEPFKVIYYSCKPSAGAGADVTICEGGSAFLGSFFPIVGNTYAWTAGGGPAIGTNSALIVSPTITTTYTLTVTNSYGCSSSDQVTVTVKPNNPRFNIATNTSNPNYFTLSATPVVTNANTQPGFGEVYTIDAYNNAGTFMFSIQNPSIWWNYPLPNVFRGFDHASVGYTGTTTSLGSTPLQGTFKYNQTYHISRGTWNNDCDWRQFGYEVRVNKVGLAEPVVQIVELDEAEASSSRSAVVTREEQPASEAISIFPNPTTGQLNISLDTDLDAQVDVFDLFGKKIQSRNIAAGTRTLQIDLSGYAKGMYLIHVSKGGETSTHKVILQ